MFSAQQRNGSFKGDGRGGLWRNWCSVEGQIRIQQKVINNYKIFEDVSVQVIRVFIRVGSSWW